MWTDAIAQLSPAQRAALAARIHAQSAKPNDTQLVAYVVADGAVRVDDLRNHLAARLPVHMLPARIVPLDALPLTPNGKVDRNALPDPDAIESSPDNSDASDFVAPRTETERTIASVWRDLLSMDELSVHDNFSNWVGTLCWSRVQWRDYARRSTCRCKSMCFSSIPPSNS